MLRTGWVVVRRMTWVSPSVNSMARVVPETMTVTVCPAWLRPSAIFCPATRITPVAEMRRCTRMGSLGGRGGRAGAAQPGHLGRGERVGPGAQQGPGLGVVEHQRVLFDADADQLSAEDLGGEEPVLAEADQPAAGHRPVHLDGLAVFDGRQRRGPGWDAAVSG